MLTRGIFRVGTVGLVITVIGTSSGGTAFGEPEEKTDSLQYCDSTENALLIQQILIGDTNYPLAMRVEMTPGKGSPVVLYLDGNGSWHEPSFRAKHLYWPRTDDSVTIAVHRLIDLQRYLQRASGHEDVFNRYHGPLAAVRWGRDVPVEYTVLSKLSDIAFPADVYNYWDWGGDELNVGVYQFGSGNRPVVYARVGLTAPHDCDTYSHWLNEGLWYKRNGRFVPMGVLELSRFSNAPDEYDLRNLESTHRVEDVDGDGQNELLYARHYIIADSGRMHTFGDIGDIVMEFDDGYFPPASPSSIGNVSGISPNSPDYKPLPRGRLPSLLPDHIKVDDVTTYPCRSHMPVLMFPGPLTFGRTQSWVHGGDWSCDVGSPIGGGHVITLGSDYLNVFEERTLNDKYYPSLSSYLDGDSITFVANVFLRSDDHPYAPSCPDNLICLLLWFDTDLLGDFASEELSGDDVVFMVYAPSGDSTLHVDQYGFSNEWSPPSLLLRNESSTSFSSTPLSNRNPQVFRWRIACSDIGLSPHHATPPMCGFAVELVCGFAADAMRAGQSDLYPWTTFHPTIAYPRTFDRLDPSTWSSLMVATRRDSTYAKR